MSLQAHETPSVYIADRSTIPNGLLFLVYIFTYPNLWNTTVAMALIIFELCLDE